MNQNDCSKHSCSNDADDTGTPSTAVGTTTSHVSMNVVERKVAVALSHFSDIAKTWPSRQSVYPIPTQPLQ